MKLHLHHETMPMNTRMPEQSRIPRRGSQGFTLIELMITVAIVAILTAIAIPNYRNYVIRGQLVDATTGLSAVRANMERYYQDNRSYLIGPTAPPCGTLPAVAPIVAGNFTITCTAGANPDIFTATAIGAAGTNAAGFTFTVDQNDAQTTVVAAPAPTAFQGCLTAWITKTGGC
jgi:prepilin-type N-terminal cleavage/methylation domain-containing protein